ncbi:hypothetical protein EVAR_14902_1 [Eumeta japonica]|uniref:Uncharacterized protein n=1 Tax=Eumeta variegata TaxID=151549 RepID=A0A4C2AEW8_EUMVA|nr:hypothetical protein EVAR_14902_1 [Eumeta japonica]
MSVHIYFIICTNEKRNQLTLDTNNCLNIHSRVLNTTGHPYLQAPVVCRSPRGASRSCVVSPRACVPALGRQSVSLPCVINLNDYPERCICIISVDVLSAVIVFGVRRKAPPFSGVRSDVK